MSWNYNLKKCVGDVVNQPLQDDEERLIIKKNNSEIFIYADIDGDQLDLFTRKGVSFLVFNDEGKSFLVKRVSSFKALRDGKASYLVVAVNKEEGEYRVYAKLDFSVVRSIDDVELVKIIKINSQSSKKPSSLKKNDNEKTDNGVASKNLYFEKVTIPKNISENFSKYDFVITNSKGLIKVLKQSNKLVKTFHYVIGEVTPVLFLYYSMNKTFYYGEEQSSQSSQSNTLKKPLIITFHATLKAETEEADNNNKKQKDVDNSSNDDEIDFEEYDIEFESINLSNIVENLRNEIIIPEDNNNTDSQIQNDDTFIQQKVEIQDISSVFKN